MALNIGTLNVVLGANTTKFDRAMERLNRTMRKVGKEFKTASFQATAALTAIGFAANKTGSEFARFESKMSLVNTIIDKSRSELDVFSKSILKTSSNTGIAAEQLGTALFNITSAGVDASQSLSVLDKSVKAGKAGFTTTSNAFKAGIATANAYGMELSDLDRIFDLQFSTVKRGILTYEGLTDSIGLLLPSSARLGASLEDTFGSIAFLTRMGQTPAVAVTALSRAMEDLLQRSSELKGLGVNVFDAEGNFRGFQVVINDLANSLQGLSKEAREMKLQDIKFEMRGIRAIAPMIENVDKFNELLGQVSDSAGSMENAYKKATDNMKTGFEKVLETVKNFSKFMGVQFSPQVTGALEALNTKLNEIDFEKLFSSEKAKKLAKMAIGFGAITLAIAGIGIAIAALTSPFTKIVLVSAMVSKAVQTNFLGIGTVVKKVGQTMVDAMTGASMLVKRSIVAGASSALATSEKISKELLKVSQLPVDKKGVKEAKKSLNEMKYLINSIFPVMEKLEKQGLASTYFLKGIKDFNIRGFGKGEEDLIRLQALLVGAGNELKALNVDMSDEINKQRLQYQKFLDGEKTGLTEVIEGIQATMDTFVFEGSEAVGNKILEAITKYLEDVKKPIEQITAKAVAGVSKPGISTTGPSQNVFKPFSKIAEKAHGPLAAQMAKQAVFYERLNAKIEATDMIFTNLIAAIPVFGQAINNFKTTFADTGSVGVSLTSSLVGFLLSLEPIQQILSLLGKIITSVLNPAVLAVAKVIQIAGAVLAGTFGALVVGIGRVLQGFQFIVNKGILPMVNTIRRWFKKGEISDFTFGDDVVNAGKKIIESADRFANLPIETLLQKGDDLKSAISGAITTALDETDPKKLIDKLRQGLNTAVKEIVVAQLMEKVMKKPIENLAGNIIKSMKNGLTVKEMKAINTEMTALESETMGLATVLRELGLISKETAGNMSDLNESMRGIPSAIKVRTITHQSTDLRSLGKNGVLI